MGNRKRPSRKPKANKKKNPEVTAMRHRLNITKKQCKGLIRKSGVVEFKYDSIGDFNELFCVLAGDKPIVSMEVSDARLEELRQHQDLINQIIALARLNKIKVMIHTYKQFRFLIAFPKKHMRTALLVQYIYVTDRGRELRTDYLAGKLLGYSESNIKFFYVRNYSNGLDQYKLDKKNAKSLMRLMRTSDDYKTFANVAKQSVIDFPYI